MDKAGNDRFTALNGPQMDQLRQAKSLESVVGMDWWNLTTTDGDLPEGAKSADVFRIVLSATVVHVGAGLAAGLLPSIAFDKLATKWVMESSRDPLILAGAALLLIVAAGLACFVPARRAASVDPREAPRYQ